MKFLLLIFLVSLSFASNSFVISNEEYYKDESKKLSFQEIVLRDFSTENKKNFGFGDFAIWSKFKIQNSSDKEEIFYAINNRTTLDYVDVYIIHKDGKIEEYKLGDMLQEVNKTLSSRLLIFPISLKANEITEIYIKHLNARGIIETNWQIKDSKSTNSLIYNDSIFFGMYIGIILLLIIISFILFFAIKKAFLLYYALVAIFTLIGQLSFSGLIYSLDIGVPLYIVNHPEIALYLSSLFFILFHYDFFELEYQSNLVKKFVKLLLIIPILFTFLTIFLPVTLSNKVIPLSIFCHWFVSLSLIFIGVKMSLNGAKDGWFYVLGQTLSFICILTLTFFIISDQNVAFDLTYYGIAIASFLNLICTALALFIRLKKQQEMSLKKSEVLIELSKFHNSEMIINNIIHQWKLPISRIVAILTNLEAQIYFGKPIEKTVIEKLPEINKNAMLLAQIVQEFYKFNQNSEKSIFSFNEILNEIKDMLSSKIKEIDAIINFEFKNNNILKTNKFAILNISTILINNFLDIAKVRNIKNPLLTITIIKEKNFIKLLFEDNCKGIETTNIEKIFEPFFSMSNDKSRGLGLFIAKTLTKEKLNGKIRAYNSSNGVIFEIIF